MVLAGVDLEQDGKININFTKVGEGSQGKIRRRNKKKKAKRHQRFCPALSPFIRKLLLYPPQPGTDQSELLYIHGDSLLQA